MKFRTLLTLAFLLVLATPLFAQDAVPLGPPLPLTHKAMLTMVPLDDNGSQAVVYSAPVWSVSNAAIATVTPIPVPAGSPSGTLPMTAWFEPKVAGEVVVTAVADADPGPGVREVVAQIRLTVVGEATSAVIGVNTPVKKGS